METPPKTQCRHCLYGDHIITAWEIDWRATGFRDKDWSEPRPVAGLQLFSLPVMVDFFMNEDFDGACARFGAHRSGFGTKRSVGLGQCLNAKGGPGRHRPSLGRSDGSAVQTIYLIDK